MTAEKLEAIARAATQGTGQSQFTHPRDHNNWQANAAFARAFDAPTVLALLAVVRNAEAILPAMAECQEIARQWEPDDSSGKERQWLVRGRDAAKSLRAALAAFDALEQT